MKKISKFFFFPFIVLGFVIVLTNNCNNDEIITPPTSTSIIFNPSLNYGSVTDFEGNEYKTITIGSQVWMAENLRTTKFRNGDPIPIVIDATEWSNLTTGTYCDYGNIPSNSKIYGKLYNWYAVNDSRNIAPVGWHVATEAEWIILIDYLKGENVAGGKLKETGSTHWKSPNLLATNESGFTSLPGGARNNLGIYYDLGNKGLWWTSTDGTATAAWYRFMFYNLSSVTGGSYVKTYGFSVRCVMDK